MCIKTFILVSESDGETESRANAALVEYRERVMQRKESEKKKAEAERKKKSEEEQKRKTSGKSSGLQKLTRTQPGRKAKEAKSPVKTANKDGGGSIQG